MKKQIIVPILLFMSIFLIVGCSNKLITVTFDKDNGEEKTKTTFSKGELVTIPETPVKDGHLFIYWVDELGEPINFDEPIKKDTIIKASWVEEFYHYIIDAFENKKNPSIYRVTILKNNDIYKGAKEIYDENGDVIPQVLPPSENGNFFIKPISINKVAKLKLENDEIIELDRIDLLK